MPQLSRAQIAVYAALAVAILLIGARAVRTGEGEATAAASYTEGGSFSVSSAGGGDLVVHVAGAVVSPGVYRLPEGARVTDALQRAGGPAPRALVDAVNLAARLADGQQVVIPESVAGVAAAGAAAMPDAPISLGTATVEQLDTIEGIGPVTAQDIVDYRDEHGGLASVEQLNQISGIGPATMEALRDGLQP
jgi:competence protein ComEA